MNTRAPLAAAALVWLGGCTHYVPMVLPTLKCPIPPSLAQSCAKPQTLADGLSFADLVRGYQIDRQALQACAVQHEDLRAAVEACNAQIDQYNASLSKLAPPGALPAK